MYALQTTIGFTYARIEPLKACTSTCQNHVVKTQPAYPRLGHMALTTDINNAPFL